jgi:hypothetical protein
MHLAAELTTAATCLIIKKQRSFILSNIADLLLDLEHTSICLSTAFGLRYWLALPLEV